MKMLLGLTQPSKGEFLIFGRRFNRKSALKQIGSLIEQPSYYGHLSGRANLEIVAKIKNVNPSQISEILSIVNLKNAADKPAHSYSLGMKQRLGLAMALVGYPRLLILDEPTNGLDPAGIHEMRELICSLPATFNTTVLVSSHILPEVEQMADIVGIINQGKLVYQGTLADLQDSGRIHLRISDAIKAQNIIQQVFPIECSLINDQELSIPVLSDSDIQRLVHILVSQYSLGLSRIELERETLESIFLQLTTGGIR